MPEPTPSRYRVVRRVGAGGMGEVFLAEDTELQRPVALKVMSVGRAEDPLQRKRFRAEAQAASALSHPNICVIHEVGETPEGRPFIALEYVEGQSLDVARQQRRFSIPEILEIGVQVAEALDAAHSRHLVHRDIKPANIMLDRRGHVKVMDFGLAKRIAADPSAESFGASSLLSTQSGTLLGTPHYMSPEQALGRELDHRTDLFSLGVVLYELVTGQKPFPGTTLGEAINSVVNRAPDPLGLANPVYTPALDHIIFKCLEKDPARRYGAAREVAHDLKALLESSRRPRAAGPAKEAVPAPALPPATPPVPPPPSESSGRAHSSRMNSGIGLAVAAALVLVALGVGVWGLGHAGGRGASGSSARHQSIAVLPFENFSGEADTDYLSDGLTEEITTALSRVPGLKVASRNSAFAFKGKAKDSRSIGSALRVTSLLEGSIRKSGRQLRVTAQLVGAADGFRLWSETYDRTVDDVIAVQEEIARRIVERLQGAEAGSGGGVASRQAVAPEAHRLYLQARLFWNKRSDPGLQRAIQLFREAINKEPTYAAAHAGLASSYLLLPMYSPQSKFSEFRPRSRASALRALELDPGCAEAHAVLGNLHEAEHDLKTAETHLQRAIQLDPNYATAHHWYGRFLNLHGRRQEGWRELQTALDLDPLSPVINTSVAEWYYMSGDLARAVTEARAVMERFPDFQIIRKVLIASLLLNGQIPEALQEIERARGLQPEQPFALLGFRAYALARSGDVAGARQIAADLEEGIKEGRPLEGELAEAYYGLREYDRILDLLEPVVAKEGMDSSALCDPFGAELRALPRFKRLLERAGLQP